MTDFATAKRIHQALPDLDEPEHEEPREVCVITMVLEADDGEDLTPMIFEDEVPCWVVEDIPGWLYDEINESGWDIILSPQHRTAESGLGWCFASTWTEWALREGIAPGQPFRIRVWPPEYSQDYWGEWDCEWEWEHVDKMPYDNEDTLAAWEAWFKGVRAYRALACQAMHDLKEKRAKDVEAMYLHIEPYWTRGSYDEMCPPDGIAVKLCSNHTQAKGFGKFTWQELVTVREDSGDQRKAVEKLRALVAEKFPHVDFDKVPWRR